MSKVLILDTDYQKIFQDVEKIFAEFELNFKGKKVFIKPNILSAFPAGKGVTTHPNIVKATVQYLIRGGAQVFVGDNCGMPRSYGKNESVAKITGIYDATEGRYVNIGGSGIRVKTGLSDYPEITISKIVLECDIFISMPKFKTHLNTIITGAIKNSYGLVVGIEKTKLHCLFQNYNKFAEAIVAVFKIRPPDLIILDGVVGMEGEGPNSPTLRQINKVIVSCDAVAVDSVMCYMMGINPEFVNTLRIAKEEHLGEADISRLAIKGRLEKLKDFKLPSTYKKLGVRDSFVSSLISKIVNKGKLKILNRHCILCKQCYEVCPVNAVKFIEGHFYIDQNKCILCFCCKEICPNSAIAVEGMFGLLQKILK